jgi:hypothetical protein
MGWEEYLDLGINIAWVAGAAVFFLYQAVSGALVATTTVLLEAERVEGSPGRIRVKLVLERGDAWLVEVTRASLTVDGHTGKLPLYHPGRPSLRLAPNERAQLSFIVDAPADRDVELLAAIICRQVAWPRETRSFAQTVVPARLQ